MLKPIQLQTLAEVVRTGSFTEAGKKLGYTSSAVSQQVAALERSLGVRLVVREPAAHPVHAGRRPARRPRPPCPRRADLPRGRRARARQRDSPAGCGSAPPWTPRPASSPPPCAG